MAMPDSTAVAGNGTAYVGDRVCSMYVNSTGFGAYCTNATGRDGTGRLKSWRELMNGPVFIPCRDYPVPDGITLPAPPEGKVWKLRLTIVDYDLSQVDGGDHVHVERAIVPLSEAELGQCPEVGYMDIFWNKFQNRYPEPVLLVNPTYTPRVNVPAFFDLHRDSSYLFNDGTKPDQNLDSLPYRNGHNLTMRGVVALMTVDPGDGSKPFPCLMGVSKIGDDGYDKGSDPFDQTSMCKHVYKRSSANQPDGMYTVKLTIHWQVDYWLVGEGWKYAGEADVHAVQRLPVQEVQAIGG
jgi:hypothetical protein